MIDGAESKGLWPANPLLPEKVALVKVDYQNDVLVEDTTEETAGDTTEDPKEGTEEPDIPEIV